MHLHSNLAFIFVGGEDDELPSSVVRVLGVPFLSALPSQDMTDAIRFSPLSSFHTLRFVFTWRLPLDARSIVQRPPQHTKASMLRQVAPIAARPQAHNQPLRSFHNIHHCRVIMPLPKTVFPFTLAYGTAEFDYAGMVQRLNDPEADEAVRGIVGKKYLVWIHLVRPAPPVLSLRSSQGFTDRLPHDGLG